MGKLVPKCIAANEESIYFVARGQDPSVNRDEELVVLAKSNPSPDLRNATWTVISTALASQFDERQRAYNREKFSCYVDKNGVFTIMAKSWEATDTTIYRSRYDPKHGKWNRIDMSPPYEYGGTERSWIHTETVAATFIQYSNSRDTLPPAFKPALEIGQINEDGKEVSENLAKVNITDTLGVIYGKFYGDGQMYTTIISNTTQGNTYNQTLVYFPFKAPYNLTSPPEGAASFQWNLECRPPNSDSNAKAAHPRAQAHTMSNVYIFDSATKENLGPYPLDVGVTRTGVVLAPGPAAFPHYTLINETDGTISYTTFNAMTKSGINVTRLDPSFFTVADLENYVPRPQNNQSDKGYDATAVIWGIVAAACVSFIVLCFWSCYMYKRRRANDASVPPADRIGAVHRPGEEEDLELPVYTSTPEYANYIHPEDLAYLQRVNNPNLAEPATQGQDSSSNDTSNNNDYDHPPTNAAPGEELAATPAEAQTEGDAAGSEVSLEIPPSESPSTIVAISTEDIPTDDPPAYKEEDRT
ncbi:hypothetical protein BGZ93_008897 [Podila epicladia]|nr:hypothetical protein BGZ93_008897 [Podila epicladia]